MEDKIKLLKKYGYGYVPGTRDEWVNSKDTHISNDFVERTDIKELEKYLNN